MPMKAQREYRALSAVMEVRADAKEDEMIVEGYATTFNQPYELFTYRGTRYMEQVDPNAFEECDMDDVIMQYDHAGRVFARNGNGTLAVRPDEHGLHIRADLGGTELGRQLFEEIKGGYTTKMSFGFTVSKQERMVEEIEGKTIVHRAITGVKKLYDVSAVSLPANDATEISARNFGEGVIAEIQQELLARKERARRMQKIKLLIEMGGN